MTRGNASDSQPWGALTLENEHISVTVLPEVGAKIHEFIDRELQRDLLYHHPRVEVRAPVFGVNVDNWWSGGIDDCFPTGHACVVNGEELPFLGEVWSLPWTVEEYTGTEMRLSRTGVVTPFRMTKSLRLDPGQRSMSVSYEISNLGYEPFPYLWGIHPAVPLGQSTRIRVPATTVRYGDGRDANGSLSPEFVSGAVDNPWPVASLSEFGPTPSLSWHHVYLTGLTQGWLAVEDSVEGWGLGVTFPLEVFPWVHIWVVDGGWRGIRCAVAEPWTGAPARLDRAIESGSARLLGVGETVQADVRISSLRLGEPVPGPSEGEVS